MIKRFASKHKKDVDKLSDEEKNEALRDEKFQKIKDWLGPKDRNHPHAKNQPSWTYAFTIFYVEENAPWGVIEELYDLLVEHRESLKELPIQPPANVPYNVIDAYAKIEKTKEEKAKDKRPNYEILGDDLRLMKAGRKLKRLYNEMTRRMKDYFGSVMISADKIDKAKVEKLKQIAISLDNLPDRISHNLEGHVVTQNAWKTFAGTMRSYDDTKTYPHYSSTETALNGMITNGENFIDSWGDNIDTLADKLKKLGSLAHILYCDKGFLAVSSRTPESQKLVSGDSTWCINSDSTFWSYGHGRVQVNILNFNVSKTDPTSLLGFTINKNDSLHSTADRKNVQLIGKSLREILENRGYPKDLIEIIENKLPNERIIKNVMDSIYSETNLKDPTKILKYLTSLRKSVVSKQIESKVWEDVAPIVTDILTKTDKISHTDLIDYFKRMGIYSPVTLEIFELAIGKKYTVQDIKDIKDKTEEHFDQFEEIIKEHEEENPSEHDEEDNEIYKVFVEAVKHRAEIMRKVNAM